MPRAALTLPATPSRHSRGVQAAAAFEFQYDVIRDFGAADAGFRVEQLPDGLGSTGAWTWIETRVRFPLADRWPAGLTVGRREQDNAPDCIG
jgi:hypothetical protein